MPTLTEALNHPSARVRASAARISSSRHHDTKESTTMKTIIRWTAKRSGPQITVTGAWATDDTPARVTVKEITKQGSVTVAHGTDGQFYRLN